MPNIHIAIAGSSEAASADFVCDGVNDDVEIQAAIDATGPGGGTIFFGAGNYSVSKSIAVFSDGVSLQGDLDGGTVFKTASNWVSGTGPEGALTTGVVSFVGVDNFSARNLTIESDGLQMMNGLEAIPAGPLPAGPDGSGRICTNGVFESNTLKITQGHTYSIWSVRSENMSIINNHVDGGGTLTDSNNSQEGIEIFGGHNVLISGNHVEGIGNAAINLGGIAAATPDCSVDGITVTDNQVNDCRLGVFIGTTWDADNGAASAKDISITGNDFERLFEGGFLIRNWTGTPLNGAPEISGIEFSDNKVNLVYSNSADFTPTAVWFFDAHPGETTHGEVVVSGNEFTTTLVDDAPTPFWLNPTFSEFVGFEQFSNVTFQDNQLDLSNSDVNSRGVVLFDSQDIAVDSNTIRGAGLVSFYSDSSGFSFDGNTLLDWGRGSDQPAMMIFFSDGYNIANNEIRSAAASSALDLILDQLSIGTKIISGNLLVSGIDSTLEFSQIHNLTLTGTALHGTGNGLDNVITGSSGNNILDGGGGDDTLIGLSGDDTYYVDDSRVKVIEAAGAGFDSIYTSVSYTLGSSASVELLSTRLDAGTDSINLTGNGFDQTLTGNAGNNILDGGTGDDTLIFGSGSDIVFGGAGNDQIYSFTGLSDTLSDTLDGGPGDDNISSPGQSADVVTGGDGNDFIRFGNGDIVSGGPGADSFFLGGFNSATPYRATITDLAPGDAIKWHFPDAVFIGNSAYYFIGPITGGNGTSTALDHVEFASANGQTTLYFGFDANPGADFVLSINGAFNLSQFRVDDSDATLAINVAPATPIPSDFGGDSFSDILFRNNSTGDTGYTDIHNNVFHSLGGSPAAWSVVGLGDYNGDGFSDTLFRNNSTGDTGYTDIHNNVFHSLGGSPAAWSVVGSGDYNGDNFSDILFRNNATGDTGYTDLYNNVAHSLGGSPAAWSVVGSGDYNGDTFSDILFRNNATGDTGYTDLHNNVFHSLGGSPAAWSVVGSGDYNGDTFSDILFRNNSTGDTGYTDIHNNVFHSLGGSRAAYSVVGSGDYNGDAFSDILFRNNSTGDTDYTDLHNNVFHSLGGSPSAYLVLA
jgi:hypothetical protein